MNKERIREQFRAVLKGLSVERRLEARENLFFVLQKELEPYKSILSFSSIREEIDTSFLNEFLKNGGRLVLDPKKEFDCILVPGLAFDARGARLGRGGGFYDKLLEKHKDIPTIGVCFKEQISLKELPLEPHDKWVMKVCAF